MDQPNQGDQMHTLRTDAYYTRKQRCHLIMNDLGDPIRTSLNFTELMLWAVEQGHAEFTIVDENNKPLLRLQLHQLT
jgi:hypothetical protein